MDPLGSVRSPPVVIKLIEPLEGITAITFSLARALERFKKFCSRSERGFLGFGEVSAKTHARSGLQLSRNEAKNPKRPLLSLSSRMATAFLKSPSVARNELRWVHVQTNQTLKGFHQKTTPYKDSDEMRPVFRIPNDTAQTP